VFKAETCIFCKRKIRIFKFPHFVAELFILIANEIFNYDADASFRGLLSPYSEAAEDLSKSAPYGAASTAGRNASRKRNWRKRERDSRQQELAIREPSMTSRRSDVLRWILECEHTIVCGCRHHIGERIYCTKCGAHQLVRGWKHFDAGTVGTASESGEGCRS
jgi:hypothetical protein